MTFDDGNSRIFRRYDDPASDSSKSWCRQLFDSMKDGGIWGIPRSGLVFRKSGDQLVLVDTMPHDPAMTVSPKQLKAAQESDYRATARHFGAAGITVTRKAGGSGDMI